MNYLEEYKKLQENGEIEDVNLVNRGDSFLCVEEFHDKLIKSFLPGLIKNALSKRLAIIGFNLGFYYGGTYYVDETMNSKYHFKNACNMQDLLLFIRTIPGIVCEDSSRSIDAINYTVKISLVDAINYYYGEINNKSQKLANKRDAQSNNFMDSYSLVAFDNLNRIVEPIFEHAKSLGLPNLQFTLYVAHKNEKTKRRTVFYKDGINTYDLGTIDSLYDFLTCLKSIPGLTYDSDVDEIFGTNYIINVPIIYDKKIENDSGVAR